MIIELLQDVMKYFGRYRLISDRIDEQPYLERYYIFLRERKNFPFNIFIHKFLKSDLEVLHDHPWDFITIPLWPGYYEYTENKVEWRRPFSPKYYESKTLHRIELGPKKYCWTLFIPFRNKREWGFKTDDGWVHNEEYLKERKNEHELDLAAAEIQWAATEYLISKNKKIL